MNYAFKLAEATGGAVSVNDAASAPQDGGMLSMILMMVVMVAVFYFFLIRPQRKKDKAVKNMLNSLKPGDKICTIGGFYATIVSINDEDVTISLGTQQNIVVIKRAAVGSVVTKEGKAIAVENESAPEI
ncbi:MAG: preprotein translocase subunit YajC [Clostridia bacterium]|nr:preprotein translocase subunit YajC [Clostridia bacterium]